MGVLSRPLDVSLTEEEWVEVDERLGRLPAGSVGDVSRVLSAHVSGLVVLGLGALRRAGQAASSLAGAEGPRSSG